nr:ATP-binding protein [Natronorubrum halalkaliphilum]
MDRLINIDGSCWSDRGRIASREEDEGIGIGLALSQRIVERHVGEIWIESEPGKGATFTVTLPAIDPA